MKKGITAVVAIVLLLMMTVGAAGLAYVWVTNLQNKVQDTTGSNVKSMADEQGARIIIDSIWNNTGATDAAGATCPTGCISFNLRNTGTYPFEKSMLMFYVGSGTFTPSPVYSGTLDSKSTMTVRTNSPYPAKGQSKTVKVTTEIGSASATYLCEISSSGQVNC